MNDFPSIEFIAYSLAASAYIGYILPSLSEARIEISSTLVINDKKIKMPMKKLHLALHARISLWLFIFLWVSSSFIMIFMRVENTNNYIKSLHIDLMLWIINLAATGFALTSLLNWTKRVLPNSK